MFNKWTVLPVILNMPSFQKKKKLYSFIDLNVSGIQDTLAIHIPKPEKQNQTSCSIMCSTTEHSMIFLLFYTNNELRHWTFVEKF